jgi:glucokinase
MPNHSPNQLNLVADIGGTNTRVSLARGAELQVGTQRKFTNQEFSDLGSVLGRYIAEQGNIDCAGACVAVAGPVRDGVGHLTNLNWSIDRDMLAQATKSENVAILNDLQAQGHSLSELPQTALTGVIPGNIASPSAAKLVVGIGTGFNAAVVYDTPVNRLVPPSECGHGDLPVQTKQDFQFAQYIRQEHGFVSPDDVLSGRGLERLYRWHSAQSGKPDQRRSYEILQSLENSANPVALSSARHFVHLAAVTISNLALTYLPYGGIFLAGGVSRAFAPHYLPLGFEQSFNNKGRFSEFMANFSVSVIEDDNAALLGCASYLNDHT